ncbi:hypothetical protein K402DRAFT_401777 [Aulographum hederae CBS 113979]|uniref:Uncharacterized protein n=1 Tax=Aulographum hederae CBS 113979 TaxID=1176131 RepID=A0A6G1H9D6_9PEZI|nr:hypothetical protein K402DRAFT_401777 [Aulographum hederae CBS 113979]
MESSSSRDVSPGSPAHGSERSSKRASLESTLVDAVEKMNIQSLPHNQPIPEALRRTQAHSPPNVNRVSRHGRGKVGLKPRTGVLRIASRHTALAGAPGNGSVPFHMPFRDNHPHRITHGVDPKDIRNTRRATKTRRDTVIFQDMDLPPTPASTQKTPMELYQPRPKTPRRTPLASTTTNPRKPKFFPLTPIANDLASLAVMAEVPTSGLSIPDKDQRAAVARALRLRSGSVLTVIPPERTAWQRSMYIPGPIRIQQPYTQPAALNFSMGGVDVFGNEIEPTGTLSPRRTSEDSTIDDLVGYFDSFGFAPISCEHDLFWLGDEERTQRRYPQLSRFSGMSFASGSPRSSKHPLGIGSRPPTRPLPPSPSPPMPPPKVERVGTGIRAPRQGRGMTTTTPPVAKMKFSRLVKSATSII